MDETSELVVKKGDKLGVYFTSEITILENDFNMILNRMLNMLIGNGFLILLKDML